MQNLNRTLEFPAARADPGSGYTRHGRWFADPYAWLEQLDNAETRAWIAAQEAATQAVLRAAPGRDWLRAAVARSARYARLSAPIRTGPHGREFVWQASASDDKLKLMLRRRAGAPLETLLDPTTWASDEALVFAVPSPDGALVAFGKAVGSTHGAAIRVLDVETGRLLPDRPRGTSHETPAWRPDGSSFFYAACPEPGEVPAGEEAHWNAIYEHRLGSGAPARRVFGDDHVKEYWCSVKVSECGRFAVLYKWDFVHANAVYLLRLADGALIAVAPAMRSLNQVQVIGDSLLIHTDLDAPRGRACVAPLAAPTQWRTIIAESADTLQTVAGVAGRLYAVYARAASHRVSICAEDGAYLRELELPALGSVNRNEGEGVVSGVSGAWGGDEVWLSFESYVQPASLYRYDYAADRLIPYHVPDVGLDPAAYETNQIWYESLDGTPVSMFIIHRKGLPRDGRQPVRLSGYGGFNVALQPRFTAVGAAWLKLGGVLAFANVRGGGEYGRGWHEAAIKTRRQNAFDDYIAAARWLVAAGYTSPSRLASRGNSNGGLLVAVAAMQAPDAFGAVFCRAPTLDMLRFPEFGHMSSATVEYGSPDDPVEGPYLASYSPYHNIKPGRQYPVMMFVPALNDQLAPPYDPLKMVARLQAEAAEGGPFLLLPLHASGHGGGTTLAALIEQDVDELSFYCWALGVEPGTTSNAAMAPGRLLASYDRVAAEYAERIAGELAGKPLDRALLRAFAEQAGALGPICDLGCGPGHVAAFLASAGAAAEGIDLSGGMIANARQRYPQLTFRQGDMRSLPVADAAFGGIVAFYSIIHLAPSELEPAFHEWRRALRPAGRVLVAFHVGDTIVHLDEWWDQPVDLDFHFLQLEAVASALQQAKFTIEATVRRAPYPGVEHPSERAYILARKND